MKLSSQILGVVCAGYSSADEVAAVSGLPRREVSSYLSILTRQGMLRCVGRRRSSGYRAGCLSNVYIADLDPREAEAAIDDLPEPLKQRLAADA